MLYLDYNIDIIMIQLFFIISHKQVININRYRNSNYLKIPNFIVILIIVLVILILQVFEIHR